MIRRVDAVRGVKIHRAEELSWEEIPKPTVSAGEVLLRTAFIGLCGSDLHYYFHGANGAFKLRGPLVPGHEVSATVAEDPSGRFEVGTPVTVHPARFGPVLPGLSEKPHLSPGGDYLGSAAVFPHRDGAAMEFFTVGIDSVVELPAGVPLARAALAEPLAVALHALNCAEIDRAALAESRCLVIGSGPIGLLAIAALRKMGASMVTAVDLYSEPLARASALGASEVMRAQEFEDHSSAYHLVLECTGSSAGIEMAVNAAYYGATVVQVGMPPDSRVGIDLSTVISKELRLIGAFRFHDEIWDAVTMLSDDSFDQIITHAFPAEQAKRAFNTARNSRDSGKVLLSF